MDKAEKKILELFSYASKKVPAYKKFLSEHEINPESIKTIEDYKTLPLTTKDNYFRRYPLDELCMEGKISSMDMVSVSSGSSGEPHFWFRTTEDEEISSERFKEILFDSFNTNDADTLCVICFPLGTWVGGMFTYSCVRLAAKDMNTITPGNNKDEILRVISILSPYYKQTVLFGYPPFVKDVIDTGTAKGFKWNEHKFKFVFAGEVFSEEWRNLICERAGASEPERSTASLYGTADGGVLANETPLSISIRKFLAQRPELAREVFGESRLPTLVQYDPEVRYFETHENTLVVSGKQGTPLLRYHIADTGGIYTFKELMQKVEAEGFSYSGNYRENPFVYLFGRSLFVISFFGANIYPENITVGLERKEISGFVTGKFVLQVHEGLNEKPYISVAVELAPDAAADEDKTKLVTESILAELNRLNSEFKNYVPDEFKTPVVNLLPFGHSEYFPIGVKHRYVRK